MKKEITPAENIINNVCKIKKNESVLIIANPATDFIAQELYTAANQAGAKTSLIYQNSKTSFDNAEKTVLAAIGTNPDVCFSISENKLGKDPDATANPYKNDNGEPFTHIFDYLLEGKKSMRAVWTPGITEDMYNRTVNINYEELAERCKKLGKIFENAINVQVTAAGGTNISVPVYGRKLMNDDGDFSKPGTGGNIPAGEVFISPLVGKCQGVIVYDGSMTFSDGDSILETPITCKVENGYVTEISGGEEAKRLLKTITEAENRSIEYEKNGKLPEGQGEIYKKNARNIGELGIGLNPAASITGNMLEDEKAFRTCHFAIGENYDNDAPSLIHLDGVVRNPTITLTYDDGSTRTILSDGTLQI
ncbi:MAG: aminopeptidase [Spirochaetia bacterium]|nr:aminopeptidase [Spirochaetia bacterium]MDY2824308.1 peptidase M17 [Treponema sp.]